MVTLVTDGPVWTVSVTGIEIGLPVAKAVIVTVPVYVPAVRLAAFTDTATVPGVVPDAGVALNHPLPVAMVTAVVNASAVAGVALTEMFCAAGAAPPVCAVNESDAGVAEIVTGDVTVSVTGTLALAAVDPRAVRVIVPLYEPATSPLPLAVTVTVVGVVPELGVTVSHVAELVAVKIVAAPELTVSVCPAGAAAP